MPPFLQQLTSSLVQPVSIVGFLVLVCRLLHPALVASLKPRVSLRVKVSAFVVALVYVGVLLVAFLVALLVVAWAARLVRA